MLSHKLNTVSVLYALPPQSIGQCYNESLTSYLLRLAEVSRLTPHDLLKYVVFDYLSDNTTKRLSKSWWTFISGTINGVSDTAHDWVRVLTDLTSWQALGSSTLLSWQHTISHRGLMRRHQAYCPACIVEWEEKAFYPLLWSIKLVDVCLVHQVPLRTTCPHPSCGKPFLALSSKALIGYCAHCHYWLGVETDNHTMDFAESQLAEQLWIARSVSQLVEYGANNPRVSVKSPAEVIGGLIDTHGEGQGKTLARKANVHHKTIYQWRDGVNIPTLKMWLKISAGVDEPLISLLTPVSRKMHSMPQEMAISTLRMAPTPQEFDRSKVEQHLLAALRLSGPKSMEDVATELDYDQSHLRRHFPELCKQISDLYRDWLAEQKTLRDEETKSIVRETMLKIAQQGIYPSHKQIEASLGGIMRDPVAQETRRDVLAQLGYTID